MFCFHYKEIIVNQRKVVTAFPVGYIFPTSLTNQ